MLRHKGAPHIKSVAPQLSINELYNIDAYFIIITILILNILVSIMIIRKGIQLIFRTEKEKIKTN